MAAGAPHSGVHGRAIADDLSEEEQLTLSETVALLERLAGD